MMSKKAELKQLAQFFLDILINHGNASAERFFTEWKNIVTYLRNALSTEVGTTLMIVKSYLRNNDF